MHFDVTGEGRVVRTLFEKENIPIIPHVLHKLSLSSYKKNIPNQKNEHAVYLSGSEPFWRPSLSLGGARTGLAFHSHGHTWQAVLSGKKLWMLLPPGNPPSEIINRKIYLSSVNTWIDEILSVFEKNQKERNENDADCKNINNDNNINDDNDKKNVYQQTYTNTILNTLRVCIVKEGELIWIPAGWYHATFNLGETLAIGAQQSLRALKFEQLKKYPESPLFLSQMGELFYENHQDQQSLHFFQMAYEKEQWNFKTASNYISVLLAMGQIELAATSFIEVIKRLKQAGKEKWIQDEEIVYTISYHAFIFYEAVLSQGMKDIVRKSQNEDKKGDTSYIVALLRLVVLWLDEASSFNSPLSDKAQYVLNHSQKYLSRIP